MNRLRLQFFFVNSSKALCREKIELPETCVADEERNIRNCVFKFASRREDVHKIHVVPTGRLNAGELIEAICHIRNVTATFGALLFTAD